jgi:hypothetical protein
MNTQVVVFYSFGQALQARPASPSMVLLIVFDGLAIKS